MNGAVMWKKGLWWYNARSSREFTVGDDIQVTAEWHVALRTNWEALAPNDPRRNQGPFCIEYLALKDERGKSLVDYKGDKSPLLESTVLNSSCFLKSKISEDFLNLFTLYVAIVFKFHGACRS